jgi:hypothetical protein
MKNFVVFDGLTGRIFRSGTVPDSHLNQQAASPGEIAIEAVGRDDTHYVDLATSTVRSKSPMGATIDAATVPADGTTPVTIALPVGVDVSVFDEIDKLAEQENLPDDTLGLTFDEPGTYLVSLTGVRYLPQEFTVVAT